MPSKKIVASKKAVRKSAANKAAPAAKKTAAKATPPAAAATFRVKIDLAALAIGAKTIKQLARAVNKLAQTLAKMEDAGSVSLEAPVTGKVASLVTQDAKAARRFGMEEGRAPRGAKAATPAAKKATAKKAATKKVAAKAAPAEAAETSEAKTPAAKGGAATKAATKKAPARKAARKKAANAVAEPRNAAAPVEPTAAENLAAES
ncbi:hypothetical protein [uncultured Azohydromonas sp.]|jgi:hypothetical protein|uniref:hypothetical protein n=1 Tax=uncultured Azohydromonas sp. TaxID=487342 RepID=UPI00262CC3DB|nr:hypothetical protein [uncultured Azohydromonas sp.]